MMTIEPDSHRDYTIHILKSDNDETYYSEVYRKPVLHQEPVRTFTSYPFKSEQEAKTAALEYLKFLRRPIEINKD